ncbi:MULTISPECIES: nitronate monooxygenase [unclassified Mycobacteroides]|uniref:nitronate monooxygenase n=1 Tax=unclassified Mycobacteroides TaxID=2618759 RepID=UPI0035C8765D
MTTFGEAELALGAGVDMLAAQGPDAGGHRGTFDPAATPATEPLTSLLAGLIGKLEVPVIPAGGVTTGSDLAAALSAGAVAAQLGTTFLLADEAGSSPVRRAALQDPDFSETIVTKVFSGRYARGLRNRFISEHEAQAPWGYTEVHYLTSPIRAATVRAGDPDGTNVWAGDGFKRARNRIYR